MNKKTIGIVGPIASGKDTVVKILVEKGYKAFFLGDRTREEAARLELPVTRSILQDVGNELRRKFGSEILIKQTEELFAENDKIVIDGIRNTGEIKYLRKKYNAVIIGIKAPINSRKLFSSKRKGDADPKSEAEFLKAERRDRGIGEKSYGQQVEDCLNLSDMVINNNGSRQDFISKIQKSLTKLDL